MIKRESFCGGVFENTEIVRELGRFDGETIFIDDKRNCGRLRFCSRNDISVRQCYLFA